MTGLDFEVTVSITLLIVGLTLLLGPIAMVVGATAWLLLNLVVP